MRGRGALTLLLLLAACAAEPVGWMRPGIAEEHAASDLSTCRAEARATVNQALASESSRLDMFAAPPTLSGHSSSIVENLQRDRLAAEGRRRQDTQTAACMRAKGYSPR